MVIVATDPNTPRVRQLQAALGAAVVSSPPADGPALWASPWLRDTPLPGGAHGIQVMDLHGAIAACPGWGEAAEARWVRRVAQRCRGAALVLVGSAAEHGFWSMPLIEAGITAPVAVVPYAPDLKPISVPKGAHPAVLHIAGAPDHPALRPVLASAIAWAKGAGLIPETSASPVGQLVVAAQSGITQHHAATPYLAALLLDLRPDTAAQRAATPVWVADALAAGTPVLSTVDGPLMAAIQAADAGLVLTDGFVPWTTDATSQAITLAGALFSRDAAASALHRAIAAATAAADRIAGTWATGNTPPPPLGPDGHVLVVSQESTNLAAVRVHLPFGALYQRGAIGGYAVLHKGAIVFDTESNREAPFDAIWVHRSMEPEHRLLLDLLGRPFAYDIDDNLLATPAYRESFPSIARRTMQDLLHSATAISCATRRLAGLLIDRASASLAERMTITPNLAQDCPATRQPGAPRALIWASSDRPALTTSSDAIIRAVRDHCLAHGVKLVCIGAAPPHALAASRVELEAVDLLSHDDYRALLRSLAPAILVCPLETNADSETQDFVDGKSDIKIIEALSDGLVGVFSDAAPYRDSTIPGQILCENTYDSWLNGLAAARAACIQPAVAGTWPPERDSAGIGLAPWADALAQVRLDRPVGLAELQWAAAEVDARYDTMLTRDEFDEAFYRESHDDVRQAIDDGLVASGFDHFMLAGRVERRRARRKRRIASEAEIWWDDLMHESARAEAAAADHDDQIDALERRVALRLSLEHRS